MSKRLGIVLTLLALFVSSLASAQKKKPQPDDDAPIPYSDDDKEDERNLPKRSDPTPDVREETEVEQLDRERSLASLDDPSIGISAEFVAGAMLLESSKGGGVEPRFVGGARLTWEWTRTLLSDEFTRELSFVDVGWEYTSWGDGTREVNGTSAYHYFTFAPALAYPLGKSPISVFGQVGLGFNYNASSITIDNTTTSLSGSKFLLQYGLGLRGRPLVHKWDGGALRISFRFEITRFRRGYMDDTMVGGSVGITF